MKLSNRVAPLSIATIIGVVVGIVITSIFSFPSANAAPPTGFVLTGVLQVPSVPNGTLHRLEDQESKVICYVFEESRASASYFSCVKK